jgi:uncharacterized protein YqeY
MSLKARLSEDVKTAMRAQDKPRLGVLRLVTAAIKQREVDERIELDDTAVLAVLDKMAKQRRESIEQFQAAKRQDLVDKEQFELEVIQSYLPEPLDDAALEALIDRAIASVGASGMQDMGAVMNELRPEVQGRADMKAVSGAVRARLGA